MELPVVKAPTFDISLNGKQITLDSVDPTMSLLTFIRSQPGYSGTKKSCYEGGCGACTVLLTHSDANGNVTSKSINSCLRPLAACNQAQITTVEGLGSQKSGFHPIQSTLADHDGTQCGFCSPGFVMNMYSLLTNNSTPTEEEVEKYFDGNICRCTGYRPIFSAFKTFASNQEKSSHENGSCTSGGSCNHDCGGCSKKSTCSNPKNAFKDIEDIKCCTSQTKNAEVMLREKIVSNGRKAYELSNPNAAVQWLVPTSLNDVYNYISSNPQASLVFGHTSWGVYKDWRPSAFIDLSYVKELTGTNYNATLNVLEYGACTTITEFLQSLNQYQNGTTLTTTQKAVLPPLIRQVNRVASTQIRNAGSIAGNIMLANKHSFPSDIVIALMGLGAKIFVGNNGVVTVVPIDQFVTTDMTGRVLLKIQIPLGVANQTYRNYKTANRSVFSHAIVNASFSATVLNGTIVATPFIAYGNIRSKQARMTNTENYLLGRKVIDPLVLSTALNILQSELNPDNSIGQTQYRINLALSFFYKFFLSLLPSLPSNLQSAITPFVRGVSSGQQAYQTNPSTYPVSEPVHKLSGKLQTSGEALFSDDIPVPSNTVYGAFVMSDQANADIQSVDISKALNIPGVVGWVSASDVPGNNIIPATSIPLFAQGSVSYDGQAIGFLLAKDQATAYKAVHAVTVNYANARTPIISIQDAIKNNSFFPNQVPPVQLGNIDNGLKESDHIIKNTVNIGSQYHFHMETQTCTTIPQEDNQFKLYSATQDTTTAQQTISSILNIPQNKINIEVKRCGGGYGGKLSNSLVISGATAVAANKYNVPVRAVMELETNMRMLGKRPEYYVEYTVGFSNSGILKALEVKIYCNGGITGNETMATLMVLLNTLDSSYSVPNFYASGVVCKTNTPANTSVRGPGWIPGIFIIEHIMENVAIYLNQPADVIKRQNFFTKGQVTPNGTRLVNWNLDNIWDQLKTSSNYDQRYQEIQQYNAQNKWTKRGISIVPCRFGAFWATDMQSTLISIYGDGSVVVSHSGVEIGQGINVKVAQTVAYGLGIPMSLITVTHRDTILSPNISATGGSVTSELCCKSALQACDVLNQRLSPLKNTLGKDITWQQLIAKAVAAGLDLQAKGQVFPGPGPYSPLFQYQSYSACVQEIFLDVLTGEHQLIRTDILFDAGTSLNPLVDIGQIEGAFVMGLGLMLTEQITYDDKGALNNRNTWEYKPPTGQDIPLDFRVTLLKDTPNPLGFMGAKITGEPPLALSCSTLFAIQQAVKSSRSDRQKPINDVSIDAPGTVERCQLSALVSPSDLTF
eukprot:TRINITY_DN8602_c0_g1_i1.p1 TRINITY_DN8602_c0_g1~~TRINITY_DN8602_c0_g1_i1.p1  ORF type:complete len:1453 (+),score=397.51 TRINITY_DN8602_c0_g1_i1:448-4359(+)